MNQTTTGCGNCYYYFNGQCTKVDKCMHTSNYNTITLNHTIGINEAASSLPDDIVNNLPDDYTIPNLTVPEDMWYPPKKTCNNCLKWGICKKCKKRQRCLQEVRTVTIKATYNMGRYNITSTRTYRIMHITIQAAHSIVD